MKHRDAIAGMLVVTPMGHVGEITYVENTSGRCWLAYRGKDSHLGGVELDPRLLREATPRELLAAGVEA